MYVGTIEMKYLAYIYMLVINVKLFVGRIQHNRFRIVGIHAAVILVSYKAHHVMSQFSLVTLVNQVESDMCTDYELIDLLVDCLKAHH